MKEKMTEIRRQAWHALGLVAVPVVVFLDVDVLAKIGIVLTLLSLGLYWYFDLRKIRREKIRRWIEDVFDEETKKLIKTPAEMLEQAEDVIVENVFNQFTRKKANSGFITIFAYFFSLTCVLILFGKEITAVCIVALALGDSMSTIIGKFFGKHKLPYNILKSFEGSIAFAISTGAGLGIMYYFFPVLAIPGIKIGWIILFSAVAGAVLESFDIIDDNYMVPLGLGLLLFLLTLLF